MMLIVAVITAAAIVTIVLVVSTSVVAIDTISTCIFNVKIQLILKGGFVIIFFNI